MRQSAPRVLGDCHNFGRRVSERDGVVVKPRTVFWEWLFLSSESPLRVFLDEAKRRDGLPEQTFAFLPDLKFTTPQARDGGEVERMTLEPLPDLSVEQRRELAAIVGRSLAFWSFFGVADLHWENIVIGLQAGQIVFTPLDIEMVLADLSLPTETKLIPDADPDVADICRHAAGVRRVLPYLGKPVDAADLVILTSHYVRLLQFLEHHAQELANVFAALPALKSIPIRVILRGTDEYVQGDPKSLWPPLLDEEKEQMVRGDIPYFFRLYEQPGIHCFADRELTQIKTLSTEGDVPQLDPILQTKKGFRSKSRKTLREEGLLTVLGAFEHKSFKGVHAHEGLEVTFQKKTLIVKLPDGEEIEARRDLSEFVGSVYLSCHCGETRSVFVPRVTVCELR